MNKYKSEVHAIPGAIHYQWVIFGILSLSHLLMAMFFYSWGPLALIIKGEMQINNSQLGFVISGMYLAMVIVSVPSGFLVDKYGAKGMLIVSASLIGIAFFLLSVFPFYMALFVVSALGGIGYGMINQVTTKGLMYWFEPSKRATIMGIKQTGVTIGGSLIAIYIPFFGQIFGWQRAVLFLAFVIFAMVLISIFLYKEKPEINIAPPSAGPLPKKEKADLRSVLLKPVIISLTLIFALMAASQACLVSFFVIYAQETFHLTEVVAGSLLTVAMAAGTISRIVFGLISDRVFRGDRVATLALLALIGVLNTLVLVFVHHGTPLWLLFCVSAFLGVSLIGWNSLAITLVAEIAGNDRVGAVMGILFTIAWAGMVAAPPFFGFIVDLKGYASGWLMLAIITGISFLGFTMIWKEERKRDHPCIS